MDRPTITAELLASMIEAAPGRVRKRLDKDPVAGKKWKWKIANTDNSEWQVQAGDETVTLAGSEISQLQQVSCTCLLAPKCFHLLACVTLLKVAEPEVSEPTAKPLTNSASHELNDGSDQDETASSDAEQVIVTNAMRKVTRAARDAVANAVKVGARTTGTLFQSALLRASHDCRAQGLPMLSNGLLRLVEATQQIRGQQDHADSLNLRSDLFSVLQATELILQTNETNLGQETEQDQISTVPIWAIGINRRQFHPVAVKGLTGIYAEPILTRSGFAGICVVMRGNDQRLYQIVESRMADSQWVAQCYEGGIDLGLITVSGKQLCRSDLAAQHVTASIDGRLGKGKKGRWAIQASKQQSPLSLTGQTNLQQQVESVLQAAELPVENRRAAWDVVSFDAEVVGASGAALLVNVPNCREPWKLRIAIDSAKLPFRSNLQWLARCIGLRFRCVGRLHLQAAGHVDALAIGFSEQQDEVHLPKDWKRVCNLGIDRLQRHFFKNTSRFAQEVTLSEQRLESNLGLGELDRRLTSIVLGGYRAIANVESETHRTEIARLRKRNLYAAASLLDALAKSSSDLRQRPFVSGANLETETLEFDSMILACETYLQAARIEYQAQQWREFLA